MDFFKFFVIILKKINIYKKRLEMIFYNWNLFIITYKCYVVLDKGSIFRELITYFSRTTQLLVALDYTTNFARGHLWQYLFWHPTPSGGVKGTCFTSKIGKLPFFCWLPVNRYSAENEKKLQYVLFLVAKWKLSFR